MKFVTLYLRFGRVYCIYLVKSGKILPFFRSAIVHIYYLRHYRNKFTFLSLVVPFFVQFTLRTGLPEISA